MTIAKTITTIVRIVRKRDERLKELDEGLAGVNEWLIINEYLTVLSCFPKLELCGIINF